MKNKKSAIKQVEKHSVLSCFHQLKLMVSSIVTPYRDNVLGDSYVNEKAQQGILIDLYAIKYGNPKDTNWQINDNMEPILYGNFRLWFLCDSLFWYAVEFNGNFYAFDIRNLFEKLGFETPQENIQDKRKWLVTLINKLESSKYFFDIENSIRRL